MRLHHKLLVKLNAAGKIDWVAHRRGLQPHLRP
jgi:hypothetical protein